MKVIYNLLFYVLRLFMFAYLLKFVHILKVECSVEEGQEGIHKLELRRKM